MELKVYDRYKQLRVTLSPDDSSQHHSEIGGDDYISISCTCYECVVLEVGDYVIFEGEKYWIIESYTPKQDSVSKWTYSVKFYGASSIIKGALMLNPEGTPMFVLTAPAREHLAFVVKNLNRWMGSITDWKVGNCVATENLVIDYSEGVYCNEALKKIADGAATEWWIEGMTINIGRCEIGEEIPLAYNKGLRNIERDNADNVKFFTRLFPIGSTKNIDAEKYGYSTLQLPSHNAYVEKNTEYGTIEHYEKEAFNDIFPRRTGTVSSVRSEIAKDDDGKEFTVYYFSDGDLNFDPNKYEIASLVKHVIFQDGELAGRDFEVNYNSTKKEFEIITTWPYDDDTQLPGGLLIPASGNKYILYNITMPDEYYPLAEQEYAIAVDKFMEEHCIDRSVYKSPTDYTYIEANGIKLKIGQRVRLESDLYFPKTGFRNSRITVVSQNLLRPGQADIEISDVLSQTSQSKLTDELENVKTEIKTSTTTFPDIIRSWDNTQPTDNNLFSARRTQKEFASKIKEDTFQKKMRFLEGLDISDYIQGEKGGHIDGDGNAELLSLVIRNLLRSTKFVDGFTGEGFQMWMDALDGLSHLTVDKLTVRQTMTVLELLIQKVRSIGGQFIVSAANGKIASVAEDGDNYIICFEQDNTFIAHDLMRCAVMSGTNQHAYWVEISKVSTDCVTVAKSEFSGIMPLAGDEVVLMGNTTDKLRQNLISIAATEDGQPRVDVLDGVSNKSFKDCLRVRLGNLDGISDDRFPLDNQPKGNGLYGDNVYLVGTFMLTTGEDILTKFNIMEGKIESAIEGLRTDFATDRGYLGNPTFDNGLEKWNTENEATFFLLGNRWIWTNNAPLSNKTNYACVRTNDGRKCVFIRNKYILQKNSDFRSIPEFTDTDAEGLKKAEAVYLTFFYKCTKPGHLLINFENVDKTGFENFNAFSVDEDVSATEGFVIFNRDGLWNGTGDFKLTFTGEIYLYMLILSTDRVNALAYKYKTLFEQSERLVKISAAVFDKDQKMLEETGLMVTSQMSGLYAIDGDGNLRSFVGAGQEGVKIKATNIVFEGLVTANSYFKILEDGSIEAQNANIKNGKIGGFVLANGRIGAETTSDGNGGGLAIYDDFIRVGGSKGYVMFGNDVIPATAGGAFTAAGRIVNNAPNTFGTYGFDQANYGLFISVSGGTKNYGICSDAPLLAPAFINTAVKELTFSGGSYSVDFSQASIFMLFASSASSVTLPSEDSVAYKFGYTKLPDNFGTLVLFKVRPGSSSIRLDGIYNSNDGLQNFDMAQGDSVWVLISKIDGFRYSIINYTT
ncbi:MAG: hypothetical protein WCS17_00040 [Prevotella sp.]